MSVAAVLPNQPAAPAPARTNQSLRCSYCLLATAVQSAVLGAVLPLWHQSFCELADCTFVEK
eukprot:COSAG01_NODE_61973_length_287_cov_0.340426_1_plen_61_part_01